MKPEKLKYFGGICLVLLANVLTVLSNYFVKAFKTSSADIILFKGLFQAPLFAIIILILKRKLSQSLDVTNDQQERKEVAFFPAKIKEKIASISYGFFGGVRYASIYTSVLFIPMADFIVITATTPIFSYLFSRIFLKTKLTILKISFCITVIPGVILVVKPPFIYGKDEVVAGPDNSTEITGADQTDSASKFTPYYWMGAAFAFSFSISSAMSNVIPVYCKSVALQVLMFWAGVGCVVVAFILPFIPKLTLRTVFDFAAMTLFDWLSVSGLGLIALGVNLLLIVATLWSTPTVMSMMRRSEILLVLFIDMAYYGIYPDLHGSIGYALVLVSVLGMAAANDIQSWIDRRAAARRGEFEQTSGLSHSSIMSRFRYFCGIAFVSLANVVAVISNYIIKATNTASADIILIKGCIQTPLFGLLVYLRSRKRDPENHDDEDEQLKHSLIKKIIGFIIYGLTNGIRTACLFSAVLFIPVADFTVIASTIPIFNYLLSRVVLKTKLTLLKIFICLLVIAGVIQVINPTSLINSETDSKFVPLYWFGFSLAMMFALTCAIVNVIPCKFRDISTSSFMIADGIGCIVVSFFLPLIPNLKMAIIQRPASLSLEECLIIIGLAIGALAFNQLLLLGTTWSSPTMLAMTRRSEILIVVLIDVVYFKNYPSPLEAGGYVLILVSVVSYVLADSIQNWIFKKLCRVGGGDRENSGNGSE